MTSVNRTQGAGPIWPNNNGGNKVQPQVTPQVQPQRAQPAEEKFDIDMSAADVQAAMNKALGFVRTTSPQTVDYKAIGKVAAQDPVAFVRNYAPQGAYERVDASLSAHLPALDAQEYAMSEAHAHSELAKLGPEKFVTSNTTPERRAEIEAGFSERNSSPRAFTDVFLDVFAA